MADLPQRFFAREHAPENISRKIAYGFILLIRTIFSADRAGYSCVYPLARLADNQDMSGHSHWAGIKHKKAITDAKRASVFTKFGKLITVAAREGGGDPVMNVRLRLAIDRARSANMPKDGIDRAVKRGTGELKEGVEIQEIVYEGYGPGQVAMMIATATDNKNRTLSEVKTLLKKSGGQLVASGSVGYLFQNIGIIELSQEQTLSSDEIELSAIDAGAQDIESTENGFVIYTDPKDLKVVESALEKAGLAIENSSLGYRPHQKFTLPESSRMAYENLLEQLDEQEDVQNVYDNL